MFMSEERKSEDFMMRLARFIVDKRKAIYLVFLAAVLFCASSVGKVKVNDDITAYLPADTETRRGLTLMEEEFTTLGAGEFMLRRCFVCHGTGARCNRRFHHLIVIFWDNFLDLSQNVTRGLGCHRWDACFLEAEQV